jgi:cyclic pyranopterin phosphate synthase
MLAQRYCGWTTLSYDEVAGKGAARIAFSSVEVTRATQYAAEKTDCALALHGLLHPKIEDDAKLGFVYGTIEMPVLPVLWRMERNGVLLDRLASPLVAAGLRRVNVSLDTLNHVRFAEITRRDALDAVLRGLAEAERHPELRPIKINCVAVKGFTETEVPALAELARRKPYVVRFIEFMPLDADEAWREDDVLTGGEIRRIVEEHHGPLVELPAKASSTAQRFGFADGEGELGFVNPVSEPFCSSCDRIRLTADGQLRTCLFSRREWDLKGPLRRGATDDEVVELLRFAVRHKELKHRINDPGFVRASRSMSQIGG